MKIIDINWCRTYIWTILVSRSPVPEFNCRQNIAMGKISPPVLHIKCNYALDTLWSLNLIWKTGRPEDLSFLISIWDNASHGTRLARLPVLPIQTAFSIRYQKRKIYLCVCVYFPMLIAALHDVDLLKSVLFPWRGNRKHINKFKWLQLTWMNEWVNEFFFVSNSHTNGRPRYTTRYIVLYRLLNYFLTLIMYILDCIDPPTAFKL